MRKGIIKNACMGILILFSLSSLHAQQITSASKAGIVAWDGMVVAGYVNQGSYINFGGPSIRLVKKPWAFGFGILPTMRIKKEKVSEGATRNSILTPTAGFGFTFAYRHMVVQLPFYYNSKTAVSNGKWNAGAGLGFRF